MTIQLALLALIETIPSDSDEQQLENLKEEFKKYIFLEKQSNPKLNPTNFDREQYEAVVEHVYEKEDIFELKENNISKENKKKSKIVRTFQTFREKFEYFINERKNDEIQEDSNIINCLKNTLLSGFDLVLIELEKTDEAQKIFESLNNTAKPLTTFDLIRNNVFYRADKEQKGEDVKLFNSALWQQLEQPYWEKKATKARTDKKNHIENYIYRMLIAKLKDKNMRFNRNDIFKSYKKFAEKYDKVEVEIESMTEYVEIYQYLASKELPQQNSTIRELNFGIFFYEVSDNGVFYSLLFLILKNELEKQEKQKMIDLLESYVIRRGVCGLTSKNYNQLVANICQDMGSNISYQKLFDYLMKLTEDSNKFPDEEEVEKGCIHENFYKHRIKNYIFEEIEKSFDSSMQETDIKKNLTVDHIIPKAWEKKERWKDELLKSSNKTENETKIEIDSNINTIGNLTFMSGERNTKKSNNPFDEVKSLLEDSNLKLNRELAKKEKWGIKEIHERSRELAKIICKRWI